MHTAPYWRIEPSPLSQIERSKLVDVLLNRSNRYAATCWHAGASHAKKKKKSQTPRGLNPAAPPTQEERLGSEEVSENSPGALVKCRGELVRIVSLFCQSF